MTENSSIAFAGIHLNNDVDFSVITGNSVFYCNNGGSGTGYGIRIIGSGCNENTVIGNTALYNDNNWSNSGTGTFGDTTNNNLVINRTVGLRDIWAKLQKQQQMEK